MIEQRKLSQELTTIRDELRLRAHLFGMDAKQSWQNLEESLEQLQQRLQRGAHDFADATAEAAEEWVIAVRTFANVHAGLDAPVRLVMTTPVATCGMHESINRAAQLFWDTGAESVPVIDDQGVIQGILTDRDVCIAAYTQGRRLVDIDIRSAMSKVVFFVSPDDSISRVLEIMADLRVHHVPVLDSHRRVMGWVSAGDVARWVQRTRGDRDAAMAVVSAFAGPPELSSRPPGVAH